MALTQRRALLHSHFHQIQFARAYKKTRALVSICVIVVSVCSIHGTTAKGDHLSLSEPLTLRWRYLSTSTLNLTPAFDAERVYLPLAGGTIVSLKASDGALNWKSEIGGELSASPAADEYAVYVASEVIASATDSARKAGSLRALGREAGVTLWMHTLARPIRGALTLSNEMILAATTDGNVYAFDRKTGNTRWLFQQSESFNCQPVVSGTSIYVGSENGTLFSLGSDAGQLHWRYRTRGPIRGPVAIEAGTIYFGSGDGYVYAVSEADGHLLWRKRTGAGVQAVTRTDNGLLVASLDNFVYLLSFSRGKKIWKRQLPGRISSQPATTGDCALFTPFSSNAGVVLTLRDGRQVNSLSTGESTNTGASPIIVGDKVILSTEQGLLAFSHPSSQTSRR